MKAAPEAAPEAMLKAANGKAAPALAGLLPRLKVRLSEFAWPELAWPELVWPGLAWSDLVQARAGQAARPRRLNLALQGGGAHGAFTWGVLDRLLEDGRLEIASVSGTSAGAMNAVSLAQGLMEGGAPLARERMGEFWRAVSETARYSPLRPHPFEPAAARDGQVSETRMVLFDLMTRLFSPYQLNPLDFNPLREVLEQSIDFRRLRRHSPVALYIAATDVATGKPRIFRDSELSVDCLLASACLPQLHRAVKVGRRHYWDGGFSANPAILPLLEDGLAEDTLIVQLDPAVTAKVPKNARAIIARINHMTFGAPLQREIEAIEQLRALARDGWGGRWAWGWSWGSARRRRLRRHRFHHIAAGAAVRKLGPGSRLTPEWQVLCRLRDLGRAAAQTWLNQNAESLGRRSSVDLAAKFL